jgi:C4-dicarboxylate-binding protein DctP
MTTLLSMVLIGMLLAFGGSAVAASSDAVELRLSHPAAETHLYHLASVKFAEEIEKRTDGRYKIKIFPLNQLGKQEEVTEGVQLGTVAMAVTSDDKLMNLVKEFSVLGLPFLFRDHEHVHEVLNGPIGDELSAKLEKKGIKVISWLENGFRQITNNKRAIEKSDDLSGLKMRISTAKANMALFKNSGAAVTNISFSELYTALQLGTVDGQENPLSNILDKKFYEVQDYLTISGHVHTSEPMIMSTSVYKKLSPEDRKIFDEVGREVSRWAFDYAKDRYNKQLQALKDKGMKVNVLDTSKLSDAAEKVYEEFGSKYRNMIAEIKKQ